jgi:hypothetical protein
MLDQMTMPVLFAILIGLLAVITTGVFLALRIVGARNKAGDEPQPEPRLP